MNDKPIEAEIVPTQAVAVRPQAPGLPTVADLEQSFALAVRQRELLSEYIGKQLKPGKHFYQRGDQKPSLSKEGAEIILLPHNLCPDYEQTGGPSEPPEGNRPYQITVKCVLRIKGQKDSFVGSGIGSAGSEKGYWDKRSGEWKYQPRQSDKYLCHNATLKMAQKSAMIAATINSTAASEFFTQDMDDVPGQETPAQSPAPAPAPPPPKPTPAPTPPPARPEGPVKGDHWRNAFIKQIGPNNRQKATQFCIELAWILPNETLEDLPTRFIPDDKEDLQVFLNCLQQYIDDGKVIKPYEGGPIGPEEVGQNVPQGVRSTVTNVQPQSQGRPENVPGVSRGIHEEVAKGSSHVGGSEEEGELSKLRQGVSEKREDSATAMQGVRKPGDTNAPSGLQQAAGGGVAVYPPPSRTAPHDDEWWRKIIVPVPHKGQKRDAYLKNPDTIGSLFDMRHGSDDESQEARHRLWGFVNHYEPKGWKKKDGTEMPPNKSDVKFREALDAFYEWFEKNHPNEIL